MLLVLHAARLTRSSHPMQLITVARGSPRRLNHATFVVSRIVLKRPESPGLFLGSDRTTPTPSSPYRHMVFSARMRSSSGVKAAKGRSKSVENTTPAHLPSTSSGPRGKPGIGSGTHLLCSASRYNRLPQRQTHEHGIIQHPNGPLIVLILGPSNSIFFHSVKLCLVLGGERGMKKNRKGHGRLLLSHR